MTRNRLHQLFLICITSALGIFSRKYGILLPEVIANYAGDIFWALGFFWIFGFIFTTTSTFRMALLTLIFSFLIETTQLYHSPWIDSIRATYVGGLVFGNTFIWSDILCYTFGVAAGILIENRIGKIKIKMDELL